MKIRRPTKIEAVGIVVFVFVMAIATFFFMMYMWVQYDPVFAADESSAISGLRTLSSAQETFRSACVKDQDSDGVGEYGTLSELAGLQPPAGKTTAVVPPFIDTALGEGAKSGYIYEILLGKPKSDKTQDIDAEEQKYLARAWPAEDQFRSRRSWRLHRSFFIDESGIIYGGRIDGEKPPVSPWTGSPAVTKGKFREITG